MPILSSYVRLLNIRHNYVLIFHLTLLYAINTVWNVNLRM